MSQDNEHVVFFRAPDGTDDFLRVPSLADAARRVEQLCDDHVVAAPGDITVAELVVVPMSVRTYHRVEVAAAGDERADQQQEEEQQAEPGRPVQPVPAAADDVPETVVGLLPAVAPVPAPVPTPGLVPDSLPEQLAPPLDASSDVVVGLVPQHAAYGEAPGHGSDDGRPDAEDGYGIEAGDGYGIEAGDGYGIDAGDGYGIDAGDGYEDDAEDGYDPPAVPRRSSALDEAVAAVTDDEEVRATSDEPQAAERDPVDVPRQPGPAADSSFVDARGMGFFA